MLQKIFANWSLFIIGIAIIWFAYTVFLMWRFITNAEATIGLYDICKRIIKEDVSFDKQLIIEYKYGFCKAKIAFYTLLEAIQELENLVEKALKYYKRLGNIARSVNEMGEYKNKLDNVYVELKQLQEKITK